MEFNELVLKMFLGILGVSGFMQWLKNFFDFGTRKWIWSLILIFVCAGMAAIFFLCPVWIGYGVVLLAGAQLLWDNVLQAIKNIIDNIGKKTGT
jgi:hypothetical protein